MTVYFTNNSSQNVLMVVDNGEMIRLMPSETISLLRKDTDAIITPIQKELRLWEV